MKKDSRTWWRKEFEDSKILIDDLNSSINSGEGILWDGKTGISIEINCCFICDKNSDFICEQFFAEREGLA